MDNRPSIDLCQFPLHMPSLTGKFNDFLEFPYENLIKFS